MTIQMYCVYLSLLSLSVLSKQERREVSKQDRGEVSKQDIREASKPERREV